MPVMLERWNDDRMDALDSKVDALDSKVAALDAKVAALDVKVDGLGAQMSEIRKELREERKETKAGFEKMQRTLLWAAVTIIVSLLGSGSAIIAALLSSSHP
jgi:hypothetical protein